MRMDQKVTRKCYENSLRGGRDMYATTTRLWRPGVEIEPSHYGERRPGPVEEVREVEINSKKFKLGASLHKELEDKIVEII